MTPVFSIILPTYNRAELLQRATQSVLSQDFAEYELLIVDDASTDSTPQVVQGFSDSRIRYLRQSVNAGASAARNRGLREARGEWIVFLDDDDEFLPGFLSQSADFWESQPAEISFSWCGVQEVRDTDSGFEPIREKFWSPEQLASLPLPHLVCGTGYGLTLRRSCLEVVQSFDETLKSGVDLDFLLRLGRTFSSRFLPAILVRVHLHGAGQLTDPTPRKAQSFLAILRKHRPYLREHPRALLDLQLKTARLQYQTGSRNMGRKLLAQLLYSFPFQRRVWKTLGSCEFKRYLSFGRTAGSMAFGLFSLAS